MSQRFLVGPVSPSRARFWDAARQRGECLCFNASGTTDVLVGPQDGWEQVLGRLPSGWRPDFVVVDPGYVTVPWCLWDAPVPLVGWAIDWQLQWHFLRRVLPRCQVVFTDTPGVEVMRRGGFPQASPLNLFGLQGDFAEPWPEPLPPKDVDVLFIGNVNPAVQGDRLPWLGRLARLSDRWKVVIAKGVFGADYRRLLLRARVVLNRSLKGEWNLRVGEACSSGALLFQEAGNREMAGWRHGHDCVFYDDDNLEQLLEHYLRHEDQRRVVAERGRTRAQAATFASFWEQGHQHVKDNWPAILERLAERPPLAEAERLRLRIWQAMGAGDAGDPGLAGDLERALTQTADDAALLVARGLVEVLRQGRGPGGYAEETLRQAGRWFHQALARDPDHVLAALNVVEVLVALGQRDLAARGAHKLLTRLLTAPLSAADLDCPHFPPGYDFFRVQWEEAAWRNASSPAREAEAKRSLLRWRLHALLGDLTGELVHYHEAAVLRPDLPPTRAALGAALARQRRFAEAVPHLEAAVRANPLDGRAARMLFQAWADSGHADAAQALARERRLWHRAAPDLVPEEDWFAPAAPGEPPVPSGPLCVRWEGAVLAQHSLGHVNRHLALGLAGRGHEVGLTDVPSPGPEIEPGRVRSRVQERLAAQPSRPEEVCVRHHWPPSWRPPEHGHWIVIQPWEYGPVPRDWVGPLRDLVDEVWTPSTFCRSGFVQSGVPPDRVHVVPNGVDTDVFRPGRTPLPLPTKKTCKLLFVGGTLHRKGIDVLLAAYGRAFTAGDDVALVVKGMGQGTFYKGQTAEGLLADFTGHPEHPEVVCLDTSLTDAQMASLYCACDVLVHPYRGEGFGMPVAEAMACGLPVVVTGSGAALDFVDDSVGWLIPAQVVRFAEKKLGELELADHPFLAEPDVQALAGLLREVRDQPETRACKGQAGRARVVERYGWPHVVGLVEERLLQLRRQPVRRLAGALGPREAMVHGHRMRLHDPDVDLQVSRPLARGWPYEPFETDVILSHVRPGDVVIDLGANVGYYTLLLARQVGPRGRVYAFEPDPANFALLQENVRRNGYHNVVLVPKAASDRAGPVSLHLCGDNFGDHRVYDSGDGRPSVPVEAVRVDDVLGDEASRVALVKLDVQGAEGLALAGMPKLLARSPGVRLVCEFWPWGLRRAGTDPGALLRGLHEQGFQLHQINEPARRLVRTDAEALLARVPEREDAFTNLWCVHAERLRFRQGGPKVSLCVIAKNEEHNVTACLESVQDLVDEVVVVDTGSRDRTKEIALGLGARVFDFPWVDSFSAARNACLEHATGAWIFWLDADDRVDEDNRAKLRQLFASLPADDHVAYSLKCRCLPDPVTNTATVVDHVRLFRNHPKVRWRYRIHEQILGAVKDTGGEVRFADVTILHTGYVDPALRRRKLDRDLRLLQREYAEQPHDPFTLFNLGATYVELGKHRDAIPLLQESLERSHPSDSIVRKLYALQAQCRLHLGQTQEALEVCVAGLRVCPVDAELLLLEGILRGDTGDLPGAKATLLRLLSTEEGAHFKSVADGLRSWRARHHLAHVCHRLGEHQDAEWLWRQALKDNPRFLPAWAGLARLLTDLKRWSDLEAALAEVERLPQGGPEAALLRGQALFAQKQFVGAKDVLARALQERPDSLALLEWHSYALLEEDRDYEAAEAAVKRVLELDPGNANAQKNLGVLQARWRNRSGGQVP